MSTNLEVGIVGLPNVGKSTLFNAITKAGAEAANYPFCTIEPNVGVVDVPDKRLSVLGEMVKAKKIVPAAMRFVDIAGLVKGASKGEGLGNKFLAHIREVDAVAQVVRCFEDGNITHVEGSIDPLRDIEIINTELCLADMESVEKRQERLVKLLKTGDKKVPIEKAVLDKVLAGLSEAVPARRLGLTEDELEKLYTVPFFIWTNYDTPEETVDITSLDYLSTMALERAGIELPAYNKFLADMQEVVPAINSRGYYSKSKGCYLHIDEAEGEEKEWIEKYHMLQYNSMFDKKNRSSFFFPYNLKSK